jgi:uncharacterized delta-60 repeat protein
METDDFGKFLAIILAVLFCPWTFGGDAFCAVAVETWVARYDFPLYWEDGDDAWDVAVDSLGNVYVTGVSDGGVVENDCATVKYDPNGNEVWAARYDAGSYEQCMDIAVDTSGNVYVGGVGGGFGFDGYLTIKYDTDGTELWVATYEGPGTSVDGLRDVAVDDAGNVYVTGWSVGAGTEFDCATVKYDSSGNELWVSRYNGPANRTYRNDGGDELAVDSDGNVYVAGFSDGAGSMEDILAIKYDADGNELWVAHYNGSDNGTDEAIGLALDEWGNLYVTGHSYEIGTGYDYKTIKYGSDGTELWVACYDGPGNFNDSAFDIVLDREGYVLVTGSSYDGASSSYDFATVKYDTDGTELWVARYDGPDSDNDRARALAVDDFGNVGVTGESHGVGTNRDYATVRYDADGTELWVARHDGPGSWYDAPVAIAMDGTGAILVTGQVSKGQGLIYRDYGTVKYDTDGTELWVAYYNPTVLKDLDESPADLTVDSTGNVYVTGSSEGGETNREYATAKYGPDGTELWVARYDGPAGGDDQASALAVDNAGNLYVTGGSAGGSAGNDFTTVKYDTTGTELWVVRYDGPAGGNDGATAMAMDGAGNLYVTGSSQGSGGDYDYATVKWDADGTELWVARYEGPAGSDDKATAIALDGIGNAYVTGASQGGGGDQDYATVKYDTDGNEVWSVRYDAHTGSDDQPSALAVDGAGNAWVTGKSKGNNNFYDYATVKYDKDGNELWKRRYDYLGVSDDEARALVVDSAGYAHVTGRSFYMIIPYILDEMDYLTIKYGPGGEQLWAARYDPPSSDGAEDVTLDDAGNVYVTGESSRAYATVKYGPNGNQVWVARYGEPGEYSAAAALAVDEAGNVYVTGMSGNDYVTIKYAQEEGSDSGWAAAQVAEASFYGNSSSQTPSRILNNLSIFLLPVGMVVLLWYVRTRSCL